MLLIGQSSPIPKAGGTFWFRLLSDSGGPFTLTSVGCNNSASVHSSIEYDRSNYTFCATFPNNTTTSTNTYNFLVTYTLEGTSHTDTFYISQTGSSGYAYTDEFYTPFVNNFTMTFHSSFNPSTGTLTQTTTEFDPTVYTAPHYTSVADYWYAAQNGEISVGEWVYVDGQVATNYYGSYNSGGYLYNFVWRDASSSTPNIEFDMLYDTGYTKFTANPSNATKQTYKTIGFQHRAISSSATSIIISTSAFVQATASSFWPVDTGWDGTTVTRPYVQGFDVPVSNPSYVSLGNNQYSHSRNYSSTTRPRVRILNIEDSNGNLAAGQVFLQVPASAVDITETDLPANPAGSTTYGVIGTFDSTYFDYMPEIYSISFPDGQPIWISSVYISNPENDDLALNYTTTRNTSGSQRSVVVRVNWMDRYNDITITQDAYVAPPETVITPRTTQYYDQTDPTTYPGPYEADYDEGTVTFRVDTVNIQSFDVDSFTCSDASVHNLNYNVISRSYGYDLEIDLPDNTGTSSRTFTIVTEGTPVSGAIPSTPVLGYIYIKQDQIRGSISLNKSTDFLCSSADSYNNAVTYENIVVNTLQASVTSGNLSYSSCYYTNDQTYGPIVHLVLNDNTSNATRQGVVTLTAEDYAGNILTATWTIQQTASNDDSYQNLISPSSSSSNPVIVDYQNGTVTATFETYRTNGVYGVWDYYENPLKSWSATPTANGYSVTVQFNDNETYTQKNYLLRVHWINEYTEGNCMNGDWTDVCYVRQKGLPGTITLSPATATIRGEAGTTYTYSMTRNHINSNVAGYTGAAWLTATSAGSATITVTASENRTNADRTTTFYVTAYDWQGDLVTSNTVSLTQEPLNYLEWSGQTTKTIGPTEGSVQFLLSDFRVSNLTASFNGDVQIGNYTITETTGGHILTIYTADNPNYVVLHSTITVSGTNSYGETLTTDVAHLYKNGPDGSITLNPSSKTVTKTTSSFSVDITLAGMRFNTVFASNTGDVVIDNLIFNSNKSSLAVTYGTNNTNNTIYGTVTVSGVDYKNKAISATLDITQLPYDSIISITPSTQTLDYGQNTATYNVDIQYVDNVQISVSGDTSFITNRTLSNGVLTVTTADFQQKTSKTATITISGQGLMGTVSDTATLVKYGPDGTITTNPDTLVFPKSPKNKTVSITTSGIVGAVSVTSSGTVSFSSLTVSGSTLTVYTNENSTSGNLSGTITITGTDYKGNTITANISVTQKPYDSYMELTPATRTVDKDSGTTTYTLTTDDVDLSTLRVSYNGPSITNATLVGSTITVTYGASTIVANRVSTVTVSGTDVYSSSISASAELVQTGIDPTITASTLNITWNNNSATAFVATNGVGNISVSFSGDVTITDYSITPTSGGYNITIVTPNNPTNTVYNSVATVTGTVTEGQYTGQTRTTTFNIVKFGQEGVITIEPTAKTIRKVTETVEFDIALANMQNNTVTASVGTFNADKTKLTVNCGQNPSNTDRTITVTVSGTDTNGNTKSATAVITQYGIDPYINIIPASKIIAFDVLSTSFSVATYKVTGLEIEFEGALEVIDYSFDGTTLTVVTPQNDEDFSLVTEITISGIDELGDPIATTATLTKAGNVGTIIVDQSFIMPSNNSRLIIDYDLFKMDPDSIYVIGSVDTVYAIHRDKKIYVVWGQNSTNDTLEQTIYICGNDDEGLPVMVPITITKLPSGNTLTLSPYNSTVDASSGTTTITVSSSLPVTMTYSGSMEVNSCTYSNGTITVNRKANTDEEYKRLYITCKAGDVSSSAIITQEGSGEFEFSIASPATVNVDAGYHKVYFDSPSFRGEIMEPYAETGILLVNGQWPTKPTVKYNSNGFPYTGVPLNVTTVGRELRVIQIQEASYEVQMLYSIIQEAGVEPNISPIWKDFSNSVSAESFIEYHINLDGDIIYAGKAYKYPDASSITWSINDAVSNYLGNGIRFTNGIQEIPNYSKDFYMQTNNSDKFIETFYNSWAYKDTDYWLSDPIDYRVDARQWLPVSFLSTNYDMITVGGRSYAAFKPNDGWTVMTRLSNYIIDCDSDIEAVGADGDRLTYKLAKGDYVLYYSNAYGGWDSILCNGTSKKTDNIEHLNYRKKSKSQSEFSKINYQNNITPTWTLNTGITINGQKMYHLLESTMVYLHNLETNEIIPVVITNATCEYLTYTNNGKKPYFYNITVEESNLKLRK